MYFHPMPLLEENNAQVYYLFSAFEGKLVLDTGHFFVAVCSTHVSCSASGLGQNQWLLLEPVKLTQLQVSEGGMSSAGPF